MPTALDYPAMIDEAMRGVVRTALRQVAATGLPGDHHFYVSFSTVYPGVQISPALRDRFPADMTIVVQHQFWDLVVEEERFSIQLSFGNIPEKLVVPYAALTAFADPSIKFGLQFHARSPKLAANASHPDARHPAVDSAPDFEPGFAPDTGTPEEQETASAQILSLDAFRKK